MPAGQRETSRRSPAARPTSRTRSGLRQLLEAGLLKPSLVPPKPVRTLRNLTRDRKSQLRDRQRDLNRLHKIMQDTGIKLDRRAKTANRTKNTLAAQYARSPRR